MLCADELSARTQDISLVRVRKRSLVCEHARQILWACDVALEGVAMQHGRHLAA